MDPLADLRAVIGEKARLERPPKPEFGDYSTNAAMLRAPTEGKPPREVAATLAEELKQQLGDDVERIDVAGPGFLNLFMSEAWFHRAVAAAIEQGDDFGSGSGGEKVLVEFVSANPTGPMTVASARGAAIGDSLARLLEFAGNEVEREYYINDYGTQVRLFGESIRARARGEEPPEGGYQGEYIGELAGEIDGAADRDPDELAVLGVEHMMERVKGSLERFRVHFDRFFSERSMYDDGSVERVLGRLGEHVYEHEGARWLRTSSLGDEKDSVLIRSSGEPTYFASDIAYHDDKRERGYDRAINIWGADHHGYVPRIKAGLATLGHPDFVDVEVVQMVRIMRGGSEMKMSKRSGEFITLRDLFEETGVDVARYFFLMRRSDAQMLFDLDLALDHSEKNPVFKVQYAHARMHSIFRKAGRTPAEVMPTSEQLAGLIHDGETELIKQLSIFPGVVARAAEARAPHIVCEYLETTAGMVNSWYHAGNPSRNPQLAVLVADENLRAARLALANAIRIVLHNGLTLLGLGAPERMDRETEELE